VRSWARRGLVLDDIVMADAPSFLERQRGLRFKREESNVKEMEVSGREVKVTRSRYRLSLVLIVKVESAYGGFY
jgi:hypothetical protein